LVAVPVTILYDRGQTVTPAGLLQKRLPQPYLVIHPETNASAGITDGGMVKLEVSGLEFELTAHLDETIPQGVVLVPRSLGIPVHGPVAVKVSLVERVAT
jgi:anaerobic selenocysteine-containing dehydrogenase